MTTELPHLTLYIKQRPLNMIKVAFWRQVPKKHKVPITLILSKACIMTGTFPFGLLLIVAFGICYR